MSETYRMHLVCPGETMTDEDYTNGLTLLVNSPAQAKSLLHRLEQAGIDIGLNVNINKTEVLCLKQE